MSIALHSRSPYLYINIISSYCMVLWTLYPYIYIHIQYQFHAFQISSAKQMSVDSTAASVCIVTFISYIISFCLRAFGVHQCFRATFNNQLFLRKNDDLNLFIIIIFVWQSPVQQHELDVERRLRQSSARNSSSSQTFFRFQRNLRHGLLYSKATWSSPETNHPSNYTYLLSLPVFLLFSQILAREMCLI